MEDEDRSNWFTYTPQPFISSHKSETSIANSIVSSLKSFLLLSILNHPFVDMQTSFALYICFANSICFCGSSRTPNPTAKTRYDINLARQGISSSERNISSPLDISKISSEIYIDEFATQTHTPPNRLFLFW